MVFRRSVSVEGTVPVRYRDMKKAINVSGIGHRETWIGGVVLHRVVGEILTTRTEMIFGAPQDGAKTPRQALAPTPRSFLLWRA
jgi:hypothetical protein